MIRNECVLQVEYVEKGDNVLTSNGFAKGGGISAGKLKRLREKILTQFRCNCGNCIGSILWSIASFDCSCFDKKKST